MLMNINRNQSVIMKGNKPIFFLFQSKIKEEHEAHMLMEQQH